MTYAKAFLAGAASLIICAGSLSARDVNLDAIYIKRSPELTRLIDAKLELYSRAGATLAADGISFAAWRSGNSILLCREASGNSVVSEYFLPTRSLRRITSVQGAPLSFHVTSRYCLMKSATAKELSVRPYFSVIDIASGRMKKESTPALFIDYSASPFGSSYLRDTADGVVEFYPDTAVKKTLVRRNIYENIIQPGQAVTPFLSPDGSRVAVVAGAGGAYHAVIIEKGAVTRSIDGISSAGEFAWVDSSTLAYRSGSPGYYRLVLYSPAENRSRDLIASTLNTNFSYCPANGLFAALEDGSLTLRSPRTGLSELYPLEG
ncbi:MAG TPA: hypothetical protein PKK43_09810, partial [Spirochaetota bacterium]|nr:hypothetical protein [Spirochaetota bacterium]